MKKYTQIATLTLGLAAINAFAFDGANSDKYDCAISSRQIAPFEYEHDGAVISPKAASFEYEHDGAVFFPKVATIEYEHDGAVAVGGNRSIEPVSMPVNLAHSFSSDIGIQANQN